IPASVMPGVMPAVERMGEVGGLVLVFAFSFISIAVAHPLLWLQPDAGGGGGGFIGGTAAAEGCSAFIEKDFMGKFERMAKNRHHFAAPTTNAPQVCRAGKLQVSKLARTNNGVIYLGWKS